VTNKSICQNFNCSRIAPASKCSKLMETYYLACSVNMSVAT